MSENKPKTTAQAVFDSVARAMLSQSAKSVGSKGGLYANGNLRCAVGFLIPDSKLGPEIEHLAVTNPVVQQALPFQATDEVVGLLDYLQRLHDNFDVSDWARGLRAVADLTGVSASCLDAQTAAA